MNDKKNGSPITPCGLLLASSVGLLALSVQPAQANGHAQIHGRPLHDVPNSSQHSTEKIAKNAFNHSTIPNHQSFKTEQLLDSGRIVSTRFGIDLDLSSDTRNITLGTRLFGTNSSVTIVVDGKEKTLTPGVEVTAAEYVACKQVLAGLGQNLIVSGSGHATGGSVNLDSITSPHDSMRANALVVPVSVTASGDFARRGDFKLTGDLVNSGSVFFTSSNSHVRGGSLTAENITNNSGALISASADAGPMDLQLRAGNDLINMGTIASSGSLDLSAGHSIKNESSTAVLRAHNDLSLSAPNLINSGSIESLNGSVGIDAPSSILNVNNAGGTIQALQGSINIRSAQYSDIFDTTISGGNLLSHDLNLNSGGGVMTVDVQELTGRVSQTGTAAHLTANTADLELGAICLTGDPTFFNTAGNINIAGNITVAEALTIIAKGNITSANNVKISALTGNQGFPITLIAGANITSTTGGTNQTTVGPIPPANPNNGSVTIDASKASTTGGNIILGSNVVITTAPTNIGISNSGATVTLAAYSASAATGKIDISGASISTGGTGFLATNGDVNVFAGMPAAGSITTGTIDTTGASKGGGVVNIIAAQPKGFSVVFQADGSAPANSIQASPTLASAGSITTLGTINANGSVTIQSDGKVQTNQTINSGNLLTIISQNNAIKRSTIFAPTARRWLRSAISLWHRAEAVFKDSPAGSLSASISMPIP